MLSEITKNHLVAMERKPVSKKALQCGSVCDRKKR
jgi:hypothetical protein